MSISKYTVSASNGLVLILSLSLPGCTSLMGSKDRGTLDQLDLQGLKTAGYTVGANGVDTSAPTNNGAPCVYLEVNNKKRHLERIPMPVEQPMFIGDVVREAKLVEKVGRIDVVIVRSTGQNQPPIRLPVDFDGGGKHVIEGQNYSLRPGDHIVVYKNRENGFTRFVDRVIPMAKIR